MKQTVAMHTPEARAFQRVRLEYKANPTWQNFFKLRQAYARMEAAEVNHVAL